MHPDSGEKKFPKPKSIIGDIDVNDLENALLYGFTICYAQGLSQLKSTSEEKKYGLNCENICKIWRGGCIIRAKILENFMTAFQRDPDLDNLVFDSEISLMIKETDYHARKVSVFAINNKIPSLALNSSISYLDALSTAKLPMNLIQAQRDCFGEHTFERIDMDGIFHNENWQS